MQESILILISSHRSQSLLLNCKSKAMSFFFCFVFMKLPKFSMTVADQNKNRLQLAKVNRNFPTAKFCVLKCRLKMAVIYSRGLKKINHSAFGVQSCGICNSLGIRPS